MRHSVLAVAFVFALSSPAWAQSAPAAASPATPPVVALRGVIVRVAPDHESLDMRTRDGKDATLRLPRNATVAKAVAAKLTDVKPGVYVGVATLPAGDAGTQKDRKSVV